MQRQRGGDHREEGGRDEGQVVPLLRQRPALDGHRVVDADRADQCERQRADVEHQRVRHLCPGKEGPGYDGDVPAPRARSRISHTTITGTVVPMWSGEDMSTLTPLANCGPSMIPPAPPPRPTPSPPVKSPLPTTPAPPTT